MKAKSYLALGVCFFLAGCGTLRVNIDYGNIPVPSSTNTFQMSTSTPTPSGTPSPTETRTGSPTNSPSAAPDIGIVAVAAGNSHTCALTASGRVKCWGDNENGQLGNGSMVNSTVPVNVVGLTDARAITAGWRHTCALTYGGGVKCWGYNRNGELGNGTAADSSLPVEAKGLSTGVVAIDAGDDHTCAVTAAGGLMCWGYNDYGQLGDGTKSSRSVPVASAGFLGGVASVAAGWGHTCVRTTGGGAKCWGNNEYGQLGYGQSVDVRLTPVDVTGLIYGVLKISSDGGQTCALTTGGGVSCWGNNKYGQLGDGSGQERNSPVQVIGLTQGVRDVETGWNHTCAVMGGGELECWGWNYFGQLGDGTKVTQTKPVRVLWLTDGIRAVATGSAHTCVATDLGAVKCWGRNNYGQLGDGTQSDSGIPLAVVGLGSVPVGTNTITPMQTPATTGALAVSASVDYTCALTSKNEVKCWGINADGQLGDGSTDNSATPVTVKGLTGQITAIATGVYDACALFASGRMKCWGSELGGILGNGAEAGITTAVDASVVGVNIWAVALGINHTCVLTGAGGVKCWGDNDGGQLGDGTNQRSLLPVDVTGLRSGVVAISAGGDSACALTDGGAVKCWGRNGYGQLGDGTTVDRNQPVDVRELSSGVAAVAMNFSGACALMADGRVKCWGSNAAGKLGNGGTVDSSFPVDVLEEDNDFIDIEVGALSNCARTKAGKLKCWGFGNDGWMIPAFASCQPANVCNTPVEILSFAEPIAAITIDSFHACILTKAGAVRCWGKNTYGELGDGSTLPRSAPGVVVHL